MINRAIYLSSNPNRSEGSSTIAMSSIEQSVKVATQSKSPQVILTPCPPAYDSIAPCSNSYVSMFRVKLATDLNTQKQVAVKILKT